MRRTEARSHGARSACSRPWHPSAVTDNRDAVALQHGRTTATIRELGPARGAEEVTRLLDELLTILTTEVHRHRGSVVDFAGDSILCWFDDPLGDSAHECSAAARAVAAAAAMRRAMAMRRSRAERTDARFDLDVKLAIAAGRSRRFVVGDPRIRRMLVLAGRTIDRVANGEQLARPGEIVCSGEVAETLSSSITVGEQREGRSGTSYFVLADTALDLPDDAWPVCPALAIDQLRPWLLPSVTEISCGVCHAS